MSATGNDSKPLHDDPSKRWGFAEVFLTQFQASRTDLENRLNAAKESQTATSISKDEVDALSVEFEKISKSLRDAIGLIPKSDQGSCEAQLKRLEKTLEDLRKSAAPKSKFAFKRKPKTDNPSSTLSTPISPTPKPEAQSNTGTQTQTQDSTTSSSSASTSTSQLMLSSRVKQYLTIHSIDGIPSSSTSSSTSNQTSSSSPQRKPRSSDLGLSDLDHCVVNFVTPSPSYVFENEVLDISAVQIRNVKNSVLLLPRINGSVMLHDLRDCVVVLGCHQFRMHTSQAIDVFIDINLNPIIEQCHGIRFAPYPSFESDLNNGTPLDATVTSMITSASTNNSTTTVETSHQTRNVPETGLETGSGTSRTNLSVQDFSHIRPTPSPNWRLLLLNSKEDEEKRSGKLKEVMFAETLVGGVKLEGRDGDEESLVNGILEALLPPSS
ncbi:hypothetical protein K435DRAFT_777907 [Dendrothele bispora CBS 962.96]|uniref:C-CAP/cofactor C-like domain-containing protein n=1 Tax=Dendrothele bispora (strain CBS 962.96) TaxID=1314807 RepID=A0A4S8M5U2_DENBC|nr:hypothetical protein K435DRAFT_777907 [Dendrothele bispora CBS 962.96]